MGTLMQDLRYGLRMLAKNPGLTAVAVVTLALGIGANTAIFTLANGALLRPLPVEEPDRLVSVFTSQNGEGYNHSSYPDYRDLRDKDSAFSGLAAHFYYPMSLKGSGQPEVITGQVVTGNFFNVLGVKPVLGRTFNPDDDQAPGSHPVAILSYRAWQRRFAGDPEILGKSVLINSYPFTVIGVAPQGFTGLCTFLRPDVWVPTMMAQQVSMFPVEIENRGWGWLKMVGRLKPGVSLEQARAATDVLAANLGREYPETNRKKAFPMVEANDNRIGLLNTTEGAKKLLGLLMAVVGLVLLIACFNVANLQLARAAWRQREFAVRLSLGASRWRIFRQLLTESVLLALVAGAAGTLLAVWAVEALVALQASVVEFPVEMNLALDYRVLGFTLVLALASGVIFGLAPALQTTRPGLAATLKDQGTSVSRSKGRALVQRSLVIAQVALSLVLLISTGLFLRSLNNTLAVNPGFETGNRLVIPVNLGFVQYEHAKARQFLRTLVERVKALPGVESAAVAAELPLGQLHIRNLIAVDDYQPAPDEPMEVRVNFVGPKYFETLGIPILNGRGIEEQDREDAKRVAVINEVMAKRFWPGRDPIGRTIRAGGDSPVEVVGVARNGKYDTLGEKAQPYLCVPMRQVDFYLKQVSLLVKTSGDPRGLAGPVQQEIQRLDPNLPVSHVMTMKDFVDYRVQETGGPAKIVGIMGLLALILAMVGVYGVTSYAVSRRTQEFGIRMALGARRAQILKLVLRQGLIMVLIGVGMGLVVASLVARLLSSFLYGVGALDPATFVGVSLALLGVALLACYVPARRATRVDPMVALRYE
jgi:predicted permease